MTRRRAVLIVLAIVAAGGYAAWQLTSESAAIERRLEALAAEVNESTTDGRGLDARAEHLGAYFTDDVVIDLGRGAAEIRGRAVVMDMASRLQPRTSAFRLRLTDITVTLGKDRQSAGVVLTAEVIRRGGGDDSIDAREFALEMRKTSGTWQVARATVVEAFR